MGIIEYFNQLLDYPILVISSILTLVVILVNGWTDAPNSIATCVSTKAIKINNAILLATIFNFLGVLIMTLLVPNVANTMYNMVDFNTSNSSDSLSALCASMFAIVIWAIFAWIFGIPTSESHALIAGITGAGIALNGFKSINFSEWSKVIIGLILSTIIGFIFGYVITKIVKTIFINKTKNKNNKFFYNAQILSSSMMSFMHGAQDGQKFMIIFLLGISIINNDNKELFIDIPIWLMILCSVVMAIGTSIGGKRIIKSIGVDMVKLKPYQGFSADLASFICLFIFTITGIPVSTTHTKTSSILGSGVTKSIKKINLNIVKDILLTWLFTFPCCGLLGYIITKIFLFFN